MNHRTSVQFLYSHWAKLTLLCPLVISICWQLSSGNVPLLSLGHYILPYLNGDEQAQAMSVPTQAEIQSLASEKIQEDRKWDLEKSDVHISDAPILPTEILHEDQYQQALESIAATGTWQELDQHIRLGLPKKVNVASALQLAIKSQDLQKVALLLTPEFRYDVGQTTLVWREFSHQVQLALKQEDQWYFAGLMQTTNLMAKYLPKVESEEVALLMKRMVAMNQNWQRGPADVFSGRL